MVLYGWDASDFDWSRGPMDLAAARRDGIDFFTHKATEGTGVKHAHYGEALRRARAAGVPFLGAYHVVRSGSAVETQVAYCLAYANAQTPWWVDHPGWFWQVDLELWPYDAVPASRGEQFADLIEQRTGRKALIYASKGQYGDQLRGTSHALWNANYPSSRADHYRALYPGDRGAGWAAYSGVTPAIWQYSSKATIGSQPTCDANAFRGTTADFARLIGRPRDEALREEAKTMGQALLVDGLAPDPSQVWLVDASGLFRRKVDRAWGIGNDNYHHPNLLGALGNGGNVYRSAGNPDIWGRDIDTLGAAITAAQIEAIAQRAAAAVVARDDNPLSAADVPTLVAAFKQAAREGAGSGS